jgi:hypothetical protein
MGSRNFEDKEMKLLKAFFVGFVVFASTHAHADDLREFLLSCGYGTLIGATLGFATVAVADNPSGKVSNIARGASLGLYFGIGMGAYSIHKNKQTYQTQMQPSVWLSPTWNKQQRMDGFAINSVLLNF